MNSAQKKKINSEKLRRRLKLKHIEAQKKLSQNHPHVIVLSKWSLLISVLTSIRNESKAASIIMKFFISYCDSDVLQIASDAASILEANGHQAWYFDRDKTPGLMLI